MIQRQTGSCGFYHQHPPSALLGAFKINRNSSGNVLARSVRQPTQTLLSCRGFLEKDNRISLCWRLKRLHSLSSFAFPCKFTSVLQLVKTGIIIWKLQYLQPHGPCWEPGRGPAPKASWLAGAGWRGVRRAHGFSLCNGTETKGKQQLLVKRFLSLNCILVNGISFLQDHSFGYSGSSSLLQAQVAFPCGCALQWELGVTAWAPNIHKQDQELIREAGSIRL